MNVLKEELLDNPQKIRTDREAFLKNESLYKLDEQMVPRLI